MRATRAPPILKWNVHPRATCVRPTVFFPHAWFVLNTHTATIDRSRPRARVPPCTKTDRPIDRLVDGATLGRWTRRMRTSSSSSSSSLDVVVTRRDDRTRVDDIVHTRTRSRTPRTAHRAPRTGARSSSRASPIAPRPRGGASYESSHRARSATAIDPFAHGRDADEE